MHEVIGDAELAITALDMALRISVSLSGRYEISAPLPDLVTSSQPFIGRLRDHYCHIDERALGRIKGVANAGAEAAFAFDRLIDGRVYTDGRESLGLDDEMTTIFLATRHYLVSAWTELVARTGPSGE